MNPPVSSNVGLIGTFQVAHRVEAIYSDLPDEDDEELQLAIRLSMRDQVAPSSFPPQRNQYDEIFAMREAGREIHGLSVPSWFLDEINRHTEPFSASHISNREARTASSGRPNDSTRVTLRNVISVEPRNVPDWSSASVPAAAPARPISSVSISHNSTTVSQESSVRSSSNSMIDIRAARLKHFASKPAASKESSYRSLDAQTPTPSNSRAPAYEIPDGIDVVDLTGD
jgi:Holliday junction resolvase YEN1